MEVLEKLPVSRQERLEMGEKLIRFPASPEEFFESLAEYEYNVEYLNGEIISTMAYGSDPHEKLVHNADMLLGNLLDDLDYVVYVSNRPVVSPGHPSYHNADNMVVAGEPVLMQLPNGLTAVANPVLLVEVLSDSTRNYDLGEKFASYRKIPTLRQVIFIDSTRRAVTVQTKTEDGRWLLTDYENANDQIPILNEGTVSLARIYRKVFSIFQ